jgi:hypothetical protein
MKKRLIALVISTGLLFVAINYVAAQTTEIEKTIKVWLRAGIPLKSAPTRKSNTLGNIPYGAIVNPVALPGKPKTIFINFSSTGYKKPYKLKGKWVKVEFAGKQGYIFDGYLSTMPVLQIDDQGVVETEDRYLKRNYGVLVDTSRTFKGMVESSIYYKSGDIITVLFESCDDHTIFFKNLSLDDAMRFKRVLFKDADRRVDVTPKLGGGVEISYYVCR